MARGTALAAGLASGLLLMLAIGFSPESDMAQAATRHAVGLNKDDDACDEWQTGIQAAVEHMGMIQLEGTVLRKGCAVNESSPECYDEKERIAGFFSELQQGLAVQQGEGDHLPPRRERYNPDAAQQEGQYWRAA